MTKQETLARRLARKWINEQRHDSGYPPIRSLHPVWWDKYGPEFMGRAALYFPPDPPINKLNKGK